MEFFKWVMLWVVIGLMIDLGVIYLERKGFIETFGINFMALRVVIILCWPFLLLMTLIFMLFEKGDDYEQ